MILRRLGNKSKIANKIQAQFPKHRTYIEPFFGAGGMFFNKPKSPYNIVNDIDSDVFNLYQVVVNQKDELIRQFEIMPVHSDLAKYWKKNKEIEPIKKALRFLFLSNLTFMGKGETIRYGNENSKIITLNNIEKTFEFIADVQFANFDFRKFLKSIQIRDITTCFIYADPPYINTSNNYSNSFTKQDSIDLFDALEKTGCKFAYSEFDNDFIISEAKKRNLNVSIIGERKNLKNWRTEILITNYKNNPTLFDNAS